MKARNKMKSEEWIKSKLKTLKEMLPLIDNELGKQRYIGKILMLEELLED